MKAMTEGGSPARSMAPQTCLPDPTVRKQERVLFDAQPLSRRRAAGGDGAWLQGLSVTRPGFMHLARDTDPGQRQLQAPLISQFSRSAEANRASISSVSVATIACID